MQINKYIDHTLLKATATKNEIIKTCEEAKQYNFYAVCVNGCYVDVVQQNLKNTDVKIAAVIGFPLGAMTTKAKVFEAKNSIENGASEIDMVLNVGKLLNNEFEYVQNEIQEIKEAIGNNVLKVILETCYLTNNQIEKACELAVNAGADFVKTSTGFGTNGATLEHVELMKSVVKDKAQIKASGGIKSIEIAEKYIELGATRLGTSSGVLLVTKGTSDKNTY
ncbi:deoxyribose-phosphate aldolase [Polaribacter reichenbachii]|uniref:Deoxyribose-phosphate aldolase n=1 Tax=Polaribacter reichenbachii TaxID=996801 RepID=A0A1B8U4I5_9FLAO|nr:deoxyribose-phosphate aldolase [Polaribacter reichenbachii]APZ47499.1 deoxyribose-phosphate aldolase [Polaribacter reichenbachii]AUC18138.1 deoxyribose-phosphate aldolase [Polaribacter reichenbachii]OBY66749.1 2-deoxyribose-5-phosphate aldolase [Polaribacter reichenbachii]